MQYIAAFPNKGKNGPKAQLFSVDEAEIAAFVRKHDVPGIAVYRCVSPLRPDATRRCLDTVAGVDKFAIDIDFRSLTVSATEIDVRLKTLPVAPTEVRNSGGGRHIVYLLREPISADDKARGLLKLLTARFVRRSGCSSSCGPATRGGQLQLKVLARG
jgi:hypothetical protein